MNPLPIGTRIRITSGYYAGQFGTVVHVQPCPYRLTHCVEVDGMGVRWFMRSEVEQHRGELT